MKLQIKYFYIIFILFLLNHQTQALNCGDCPLCLDLSILLGLPKVCLINAPLNIALGVIATITAPLKIDTELNVLGLLTVQDQLICNGKINLLGGVLQVNGLISIQENCVIVVQNEATLNATLKTIFKDVTMTFLPPNITGVSSKLKMIGDYDMVIKNINGSSQPIFDMISTKNVNFTKSPLAGVLTPINYLKINYNDAFQSLSISQIVITTLEIVNSLTTNIVVPNAGTSNLLLRNVKASGINEAKTLIDLLNSTLEITNTILTTTVTATGSKVKLSSPLSISDVTSSNTTWDLLNTLSITTLSSSTSTWNLLNTLALAKVNSTLSTWNLSSNLTISNNFKFDQSNVFCKSQGLNLLGSGSFLSSPLEFLNNTIQQTLLIGSNAIVNLINDAAPSDIIKGTLDVLSLSSGQLNLGSLTNSQPNIIYSLGQSQILVNTIGTIKSLGSLQIAGQISPILNLNLDLKSLLVSSNNLELKGGSLNILDSIKYITKGTLKLTDNILMKVGGTPLLGGFVDQLLDNLDATLENVILSIENLLLPNRLRVLPNSSVQVSNITLESSSPLLDLLELLDLILIVSDDDSITCNGVLQTPQIVGNHTQYQFVCDERLVALRVTNCSGYTCNDGRCVNDVSLCPNGDGSCPSGLIKCWNGDCSDSVESCKPLSECGSNSLRCSDGCHPYNATDNSTVPCPETCTSSSCIDIQTPYYGCGFGSFQCPNGECVGQQSECCTLGVGNCSIQVYLTRPILSYSPVDSSKDMILPIMYHDNALNGLDVYGYVQIPNDFYSISYNDKLAIKKLSDSYLSTVNGSEVWNNSTTRTYRDSIVSLAFDLELKGLVTPVFSKPIKFELKIPNLQSYNLNEICLFFINTSTNSWQCMNESELSISNKGMLVGSTNHFTSFAVLIKSYGEDDGNGNGDGGDGGGGNDGGDGEGGTNNSGKGSSTKITKTKLIIMVASICGGAVVVSAVAAFVIQKNLKHGGLKYWWTMRNEKPSL